MDNDTTKRIYVEVDEATHRAVKVRAAKDDSTMSAVVAEAIARYLAERDRLEATQ